MSSDRRAVPTVRTPGRGARLPVLPIRSAASHGSQPSPATPEGRSALSGMGLRRDRPDRTIFARWPMPALRRTLAG